jgi:hypothetical protein
MLKYRPFRGDSSRRHPLDNRFRLWSFARITVRAQPADHHAARHSLRSSSGGESIMNRTRNLALAAAGCVLLGSTLSAQLPALSPAHINPAIEKLAAGKQIYGLLTQDISRENARTVARRDTDFIFIDMEHSPFNMEALSNFVAAMNDKAYTVKNGVRPRSALVVRMPPYASENAAWVVKQSLDIGVMGFVFNTVETKEEAEAAVQSMRYPPWRTFPNTHKGPVGIRGWSPGGAVWAWGIPQEEYRRRADVWRSTRKAT